MRIRSLIVTLLAGLMLLLSPRQAGAQVLWQHGLATEPSMREGGEVSLPDDEGVIQALDSMSTQEQEELLYLYARLNKPRMALLISRRIFAKNPAQKEALLVLASMYLERRDASGTLEYARRVQKHYPGDHQGIYFEAAAYALSGQHLRAEELLRGLKAEQFRQPGVFPYEVDYASSAWQAGNWRAAIHAYRSLLNDEQISEELRQDVRSNLDALYRQNLPQLHARTEWAELETGTIIRSDLRYEYPITSRQRLFIEYDREDLYQNGDALPYRSLLRDRQQAMVSVETYLGEHWYLRGGVGGYEDGAMGAGRLTHKLGQDGEWALFAAGNEKASDSLYANMIDARQHRLGMELSHALGYGLSFRWQGDVRMVEIKDRNYGEGYGINLGLDKLLLTKPVEVTLGYEAQYAAFDRGAVPVGLADELLNPGTTVLNRRQATEGLVDDETHRHGGTLTLRWNPLRQWQWEATGLGGFRVDQNLWDYGGFVATRYWVTKSIEAQWRGGYLSSGAAGNAATEEWLLSLALSSYF